MDVSLFWSTSVIEDHKSKMDPATPQATALVMAKQRPIWRFGERLYLVCSVAFNLNYANCPVGCLIGSQPDLGEI